jgi:ribonucleoside-diphosphate reductase alpha chain
MAEALGRTISTALRFRGSLGPKEKAKEIAGQLSGIGGRRSVGFGPNKVRSLPDAISSALSLHYGFKINGNGHSEASLQAAGAVMEAVGSALVEQTPTGYPGPTMASAVSNGASNGNGHGNGNGVVHVSDNLPDVVLPTQEEVKNYSFETAEKPGDICPACGASALVYEEGCSKCHACGHSEC